MSTEPFVGSIKIFGFSFAPRGYALCNGQMQTIQQNSALFALIGTYYGGNGQTTFALPNLQGRVPINQGQSPGTSAYSIGQMVGAENVTLTVNNLPAHNHQFVNNGSTLNAVSAKATSQSPTAGGFLARGIDQGGTDTPQIYVPAGTAGGTVALAGVNAAGTIGQTGSGNPFSVLQPLLVLNFCIATQGIYPSRN